MATARVDWQQQVSGGLIGLLVDDALGVPYEFHPPESIPPADLIEFSPPPGFHRAHVGVPPGTSSDDGAQALILLDSLLACDGLDLAHFAGGLRRWLLEGFYAVNRSVFNIGMQTSTALNRLGAGVPPESSGPSGERDNGNGSLMRVLTLALWHRGGDRELMALAARQSLPTHRHPRAHVAFALYCLWARAALEEQADPWSSAVSRLRSQGGLDLFPDVEVQRVLDPSNAMSARGTGYVLDTLWSAQVAVDRASSFEDSSRRAIMRGHDTDTTAAVARRIAGIRYGLLRVSVRWREALRGREIYEPLLATLVEHRALPRD